MAIRKVISRSIQDNTVAAADFQGAVTSLSNAGNLTFSSTGQRILGDFSNSTITNRLMFQSNTTNGQTSIGVLPNGTSTTANINLFGGIDTANASIAQYVNTGTEARLNATITGTGTFLPLTMYTGGGERLRIDTSGNVGIGTSSPARLLHISGGAGLTYFQMSNNASGNTNADGFQIAQDGANVDIINREAGHLGFNTSNTERMRITSAGRVGIATTTPQGLLDLGFGTNSYNPTHMGDLRIRSTGIPSATSAGGIEFLSSGFENGFGFRISSFDETGGSTPLVIQSRVNSATWTERIRITNDGVVFVGTTAPVGPAQFVVRATGNQSSFACWNAAGTSGFFNQISFTNNANNAIVGTIQRVNDNTIQYNTSSDYRLKENIEPMTGALVKVTQLKPVTYTWKADGTSSQGFIAHELQAVVPDAVSGEKDAVDADGKPVYQGVDTSFLVATLTAAIQEQQAIITELKARLDAAGL
jgi:hypothetical protein